MAQHIKMHIILRIRCSNQEEQLRRLSVQTVEINAFLHQHRSQSRCLYSTCLGVRNGNSLTDTRATLLFTTQHAGSVFVLIKQITASLHQRNQMLQRCCLILRLRFKVNAFYLQQINYFHLILPLLFYLLVTPCKIISSISSRVASQSLNALALPAATPRRSASS